MTPAAAPNPTTLRCCRRRVSSHGGDAGQRTVISAIIPCATCGGATLAIADEAEQGVLARLVEVELGGLLRPAVDPGRVGDVLEVERRRASVLSHERLAHLGERGAGFV